MNVHPRQDWLTRSNEQTLYHLERQGRTGLGLVPFLGAGMSTAFGFQDWKTLLTTAAPPRLAQRVTARLQKNEYEGAAELILRALGADGFQNMVAASAGDSRLESLDFSTGTISLLPLLATGPVVTTNFDRVLERAFEANRAPFEAVISGPRPDLIVDALHGNRRVLIKLHGDWQDRVGRTFAESDYDTNYGESQPERKRELLVGAERLLFSSRSLLFIGASLSIDRTVKLLQEVHGEYAGIRHFTIMNAPLTKKAFDEKEQHLRSCGVLPLWYVPATPKHHATEIHRLVARIVERMSVRSVAPPAAESRRRVLTARIVRPRQPAPPELDAHFDRIVRLVEDGRVTFFLGSAIHYPTRLMAKEFYDQLAEIFECTALKEERFAVAQYIADRYGRESLYREIQKLFARTPLVARETHEFFAAWPSFRTSAGNPIPYPLVVTTNYDDVLERRLADAGLPYHLFSYQADGPDKGLFYHRSPDNAVRVVERPMNIRALRRAFVIVKLNGGIDRQQRIPESYTTTRLDYWTLAARIPAALPAILQHRLTADPLLFLGHGLAAPDIEAFVRFAHREHPGPRSWAVVLNRQDGAEYWRQLGVEILDRPVNLYVTELAHRLGRNGRRLATRSSAGRRGRRRSSGRPARSA